MIAAIYTVLVLVFAFSSFGPIQFRVAEALTILPFFTPAAIPGVTIGCLLSGILTGAHYLDVIFGTMATLIAAIFSYKLRRNKYLVPLPPIIANTLVIPWVLRFAYGEAQPVLLMGISIAVGEFFACFLLGLVLLHSLERVKILSFSNNV